MGDIYDDDDDDETFELHELVFAQSIGVDLEEDFAAELVDLAVKALYTLPDGWEVDFAESDMGKIPFFFDTTTGESHWSHPFVEDCRVIVAEKRQELYEEYEDEGDDEGYEDEGEENIVEEGEAMGTATPARDDRSVMTGMTSIDLSLAPVVSAEAEFEPISAVQGQSSKKGRVAPPAEAELPSIPLQDDDKLKQDDESLIEQAANDDRIGSSAPSPQKRPLDTDSIVDDNNLEEPSVATNLTLDSSIAPFVEPAVELVAQELVTDEQPSLSPLSYSHVAQAEEKSKPLDSESSKIRTKSPQRSPKPSGSESSKNALTPPSRKLSFVSQEVPQLEEITRDGKKSLDTDSVATPAEDEASIASQKGVPEDEAEAHGAPEELEVASIISKGESSVETTPPKTQFNQTLEVTDIEESPEEPATESLVEPSSPPTVEDANGPASQSERVDTFSNKTSPAPTVESPKLENFASKSKVVFDDPFADFFKVESTLLAMYTESSDERSVDNPNYFHLNQSMDIDKLLAAKLKAEEEQAAKKEIERRKELARQEALRKEEEKRQKQEAANKLLQQQQQAKREAEEAEKRAAAEQAQSSVASRRNNNADDDVSSVGSSLTNATNFASIDSSMYARSIDSRNNMDLFSTTIDEGKLNAETDDMVTGTLTKSLNIFDDERFRSTKPIVPLDKSVDIKDHFLSMFRSETNSRENDSNGGLSGTSRNVSPGRMKLFTAKPRTLAKLNKDNAAATSGSNVTVKLRKKRSPKKGKTSNGAPSSSSGANKWVVLEAYSSYKEADLAIRLFERMHPTTSQVNQAFPIVAKTLPPLDNTLSTKQLDDTGLSAFNQTNGDMLAAPSTINQPKDISPLLREGVDKRTINMTIGKELPKLRIARDLSRMQWLVECNDPSAKKVFQNRIGKRLPAPLLRGNSLTGSSQVDAGPIPDDGVSGLGKSMEGVAFTASFNPQSMLSSSNSKHVSSAVPVVYSGPDIASQNNRSSARKINSTGRFSMLPQNSSNQNLNITGLPPGISPDIVSKFPSLVDRTIGPKSFRTILQNPNSPTE